MRIKSLQITGFKSFAESATFQFGDGITGVVGPNGCGKSNIIDAIRWAMGEMSAKHLRGRAMQDVIFGGSESRGPSGLAEVTITFHNDGNVPPQYQSFTEIGVTRRLHRDGTSEYLINKVQARLRDITDLFLGTGVGTRAYSIIEQGRIGFIVQSRPEDRRTLIEEVAGITKFKARRKSAERRMEATEQNLARVNDIVVELERQLESLRRQAKKAERYKRTKEELRDVDLLTATMRLLEFAGREKVLGSERARLEERYADTTREVAIGETSLEAERVRHLEEERRLQTEQTASAEVESRLAALERDLEHWRAKLTETEQRVRDAEVDVEVSRERLGNLGDEREQLTRETAHMRVLATQDRERLDAAKAAVSAAQALIDEADRQIEGVRRDALEWIHEIARQRTVLQNLTKQRVDVEGRHRRVVEELDDNRDQHAEATRRAEELDRGLEASAVELERWSARRAELGASFEAVNAEVQAGEARILELRSELAETRTRLESLEAIARRLEGFSEGVRSLLQPEGDPSSEPAVGGLRGLVSDVLRTEPRYERAIEALLGERLQLLVVDHHDAAVEAVRYLAERDGGRGGFIPHKPRWRPRLAPPPREPGILAPARDLVSVDEGYESVADHLLGSAVVVESLEVARGLFESGRIDQTLVTLAGEVLDAGGVLSGGSADTNGLLAKAREVRELREQLEVQKAAFDEATDLQARLEAERLQLEVDIQQLDKDVRQAELERLEMTKDREAAGREMARLASRSEVLELEVEQHVEELEHIAQEDAEAAEAARKAEAERHALEARVAELQSERAAHATTHAGHAEALTTLKIELASRDEKIAGSAAALTRLDHTERDLTARIERDLNTIDEGRALIADLSGRIEEGDRLAGDTAGVAGERRRALAEARATYDAERERLVEVEQVLKEQRRTNELVRESLVGIKLDQQRLDLEREQLIERVAERHDVDILRVAGDYHMRPPPTPEDHERRIQLEKSLKSMGSINLTAIEECAEVEKRYTFLVGQRDDLDAALDSLKRAIQRINRTSRQRFREAFDAVNQMFEKVFPRLFRGGEARLELLAHEDILEAGVDIIAQPPGKKLQNVSLLSGGEKALTATALIFAIFLIKPSPFCVLDEVDAPLDDANVKRFNEMLREISKVSQFIVITHNKLTMTEADRLYGITMEEPGMSKTVQVDLEESSEGTTDGEVAA